MKVLSNTDFATAMEIDDSIVGPVNVSKGFGTVREFTQIGRHSMYEDNSAWFKFTIQRDTILTFDIVPMDSLDDYDFVLLKCPDGDCAGKIGMKKLEIVRQCLSVCSSKSGMTGLSKYVPYEEIGLGDGPAYVRAVPVKAGETYYLMVEYWEQYVGWWGTPHSFKIYFYNYCPKRKPIILNNILFETNKSILKEESFKELDKLVMRLKKSPMVIEIRGHTDNVGGETKNLPLSQERAKAVKDYLISKGISTGRIYCKGFGGSKPIADNKTEEGRTKNRRVEFVILLN